MKKKVMGDVYGERNLWSVGYYLWLCIACVFNTDIHFNLLRRLIFYFIMFVDLQLLRSTNVPFGILGASAQKIDHNYCNRFSSGL